MNNMRLSDLCLRLFYVDAVLELLAPWVFPEARYVTKPLLMLLLAGYVGLESKSLLVVLFFASANMSWDVDKRVVIQVWFVLY